MKKMIPLIFCILMIPLALRAADDAQQPRNEAQVILGGIFPETKVTLQGTDALASPGLAVGARYMHNLTPVTSFGGEVISLMPGQSTSDALITDGITVSQFTSVAFFAEVRVKRDDGIVRPYGLAGVGFGSTSMKINATPQAGFVWTNTKTAETRTVVDSSKLTPALTIQSGLDFVFSDSFGGGLGVAWYYFGSATYDATAVAQQTVPGFVGISGPIASISFLGNLAYRF